MRGLSQNPRRRYEGDLAYDVAFWAHMAGAALCDLALLPYRLVRGLVR